MGSVWLSLRADLRTRWRALAGLALLLGLVGGVVLTAAAGARRSDTAYPRMLQWASAAQVDVITEVNQPPAAYFAALSRLPQVVSLSVQSEYQMALPVRHGLPQTAVDAVSSPDGVMGVSADRVKILQGRMFGPRAAGAAVIDQQLASLQHLRPGGTLRLLAVPNNRRTGNPEIGLAVPMSFRVTAIGVFDTQVVAASSGSSEPMALLSPPFARAPSSVSFTFGTQAGVRLRPGASVPAFLAAAAALAKRYPATGGFITEVSLSLARVGAVTVAGAAIAVAVAIAASPLMPIGPARLAEPSPGVEVNVAVLGAGFACIALLPVLLVAPAAWRAAGRSQSPLGVAEPAGRTQASRLGSALGLAGSVTGAIGVRMAFEPGRGRTAVPVRSALVGTTVAVAAVVAALVFGTSLIALVSTPARYGQNWDQELDLGFAGVPAWFGAKVLSAEPAITGYAAGDYG